MEEVQDREVFCKLSEVFQRGENTLIFWCWELTTEFHYAEVIVDPDKRDFAGGGGERSWRNCVQERVKREKQMAGEKSPIKTMFCKGYYLSGLFAHLLCDTKIVTKIESRSVLDKNVFNNILRFLFLFLNLEF